MANLERNGKIYFTDDELRCKGSGLLRLAPGFGEHLLDLRILWTRPMVVTSCCRSKNHNKAVGGNERSLHVCDLPFWPTEGTCAIDLKITDPIDQAAFTTLALGKGWWVGLNKAFIHIDRRIDFGIARSPGIFLY